MGRSYDIVAYTYSADIYCPEHIAAVLARDGFPVSPGEVDNALAAETMLDELAEVFCVPGAPGTVKLDRYAEETFDSGEFPKVVFRDQLNGDEHCGYERAPHPILTNELES